MPTGKNGATSCRFGGCLIPSSYNSRSTKIVRGASCAVCRLEACVVERKMRRKMADLKRVMRRASHRATVLASENCFRRDISFVEREKPFFGGIYRLLGGRNHFSARYTVCEWLVEIVGWQAKVVFGSAIAVASIVPANNANPHERSILVLTFREAWTTPMSLCAV